MDFEHSEGPPRVTARPRIENVEQFLARMLPDLDVRPLPYFTRGDVIYLKLMGVSL